MSAGLEERIGKWLGKKACWRYDVLHGPHVVNVEVALPKPEIYDHQRRASGERE